MRRRSFLGAAAAGFLAWPAAVAAERGRRLLVVHAWGGWDVTFTVDPKPMGVVDGPYVEAPGEASALVTLQGIPVLDDPVRRPAVGEFFARHGDKVTVINGLQIGAVGHHDGIRRLFGGSPAPGRPDFATVVGAHSAAPIGLADFAGLAQTGPHDPRVVRMGPRGQLRALLDPSVRYPAPLSSGHTRPMPGPTEAERALLHAHLHDRLAARAAPDETTAARLAARADALDAAEALRAHGVADALPLGHRASLRDNLTPALDLLERGVCRAALLDSGQHWDTHAQQSRQNESFQALFADLTALLDGLEARGMADVLVVVVSEMARSPNRNRDDGTEHWPVTSALWIDGHGGRVIGATDDALRARPVDPHTGAPDPAGLILRHDHLAASVLAACDVDPATVLPGSAPIGALVDG